MLKKPKVNQKVKVDFGSGAHTRIATVLETKGVLSKLKIFYENKSYDAWIKNEFIKPFKN